MAREQVEKFSYGSVALEAGVAQVDIDNLPANAKVMYCRAGEGAGALGNLSMTVVKGAIVFASDSATDDSTINYMVIV